jgi:hypothetical protein
VISKGDILRQFDGAAQRFTFPMLDNGYVYPVDVRLTAFRDDTSAHGCFTSLAEALESGDASMFNPGRPNTDWRNWPSGGTL